VSQSPDPTDEQLVNAINQGDAQDAADAFAALYRRHHDWVVSLAYRFTGDRELALDVMQDVFAYLLTRFPGFRLTAQFRTYLYPVVRSTAGTHLRRRRRTVGDQALRFVPGPAVPPSSEHAALHAAIAGLSDAHREVLLMRIVDEMHTREIAAALSIPQGTAKSRLHTALNLLRQDPALRASVDDSPSPLS
jgi:RNA polymerase sigma-70 factor, ECF subfamily